MTIINKPRKKYKHLSIFERDIIATELAAGKKISEIALILKRSKSTISREVSRNSPPVRNCKYLSHRAQLKSDERRKKSLNYGHLKDDFLRNYIIEKLKEDWSPEQIAGRIGLEYPGKKTNYETIYQYIYKENPDLIKYLRYFHGKRKKRSPKRVKNKTKIHNRVSIDKKSQEINERKRYGDWETDTAVSRQSKTVMQLSVERKSKYIQIAKLKNKSAQAMSDALMDILGKFPQNMVKSITYDNGTENAFHDKTNNALNTKSFFCNPYHSWEKGTVENSIGLVRKYLPKKTDFSKISLKEFKKIENKLNNRPRKCLGFRTPKEVFDAVALRL